MERFLLICLGGSIGTGARYLTALIAARWFGAEFPYGTLIVNLAGAFIIGLVQQLGTEAWINIFVTTTIALSLCFLGIAAGRGLMLLRS